MTNDAKFLNYLTIAELKALEAKKSVDSFAPKRFVFQTATGSAITNTERFFEAAKYSLPLNPPDISSVWDALEDSLFGGIVGLGSPSVEIVWPFADHIAIVFLIKGIKFFRRVTNSIESYDDSTNGQPTQMRLFLVCANEKSQAKLATQLWSLE